MIHSDLRDLGNWSRQQVNTALRDFELAGNLERLTDPNLAADEVSYRVKSINVRYRNKVVKGYADLKLKFAVGGMSLKAQNNFIKAMLAEGYGQPDTPMLNKAVKELTFTKTIEPTKDLQDGLPEALGKALAIAKKHGARLLGNAKELLQKETKSMTLKTKGLYPTRMQVQDQVNKLLSTGMSISEVTREVAKMFGIWDVKITNDGTVVNFGRKSITDDKGNDMKKITREVKAAPKGLESHTKDMNDDPVVDEVMEQDDTSNHPLGAQILRRLHGDHSQLMQDYDEMMGPLENEQVKKRLQKKLEDMESELSEFEDMYGKEYADLPGLAQKDMGEEVEEVQEDLDEVGDEMEDVEREVEGEEGAVKEMDSMDDAAVGAASDERDDPPTPEEAVEGMEKVDEEEEEKDKPKEDIKSIRTRYKKKDLKTTKTKDHGTCQCGQEPCICEDKVGDTGTKIGPVAAAAIPAVAGAVSGLLSSGDKRMVKEAGGFLGELAQPQSQLDDEGRMKSYHYHKTFEGMSQIEESSRDDMVKSADAAPYHKDVLDEADLANNQVVEGEMPPDEPEHMKTMRSASGLFKEFAYTRDFGDPHRMKAKAMSDALAPYGMEDDVENNSPEDVQSMEQDAPVSEPGEMGEKARIKALFERQNKDMEELHKKLQAMCV